MAGKNLALIALVGFIAVGSCGLGDASLRLLYRKQDPPTDLLTVPLRISIGLATFISVAGFLVAVDLARFYVLMVLLLVGVGVVAVDTVRKRGFASSGIGRSRLSLLVLSGGFVASLAYVIAVNGWFNPDDDDAAYLYLAKRLLATGGLIDPFNLRRITSYGAGEVFSALALQVGGPGSIHVMELFGACLLCVALVAERAARRYSPLVVLLVGGALVVVKPVGNLTNSAPTFSGVALNLAVLLVLSGVRRDDRPGRRYVLVGLLVAALFALRLEYVAPALVAAALVALLSLPPRRSVRVLAGGVGAAVVGILGWAIALQRSSGTPFFPIIDGNWNHNYPEPPVLFHGLHAFYARVVAELGSARVGAMLLAAALALFLSIALDWRAKERRVRFVEHVALAGAIVGAVIEVIAETPSLSTGALVDVGRYDAPEALVCVLFSFVLLWRRTGEPHRGTITGRVADVNRWLAAAAALVVVGYSFGLPLGEYVSSLNTDRSVYALVFHGGGFNDSWTASEGAYDAVSALVPRGSYVLAAVDLPGLLDFSKYSFTTVDEVGGASPAPGLPIFKGEAAVVHYLRSKGITAVIASSPATSGLYSESAWRSNLKTVPPVLYYLSATRYFLAWFKVLHRMMADETLHHEYVDGLIYINLTAK